MPDYSNEQTAATEKQLADFEYNLDPTKHGLDLIMREPCELESGVVYQG